MLLPTPTSAVGLILVLTERLALRWIQKHITAFGGDPEKVTMCDISSTTLHGVILTPIV